MRLIKIFELFFKKCFYLSREILPEDYLDLKIPHHTMDEFTHSHHLTKSQVEVR